MQKCVIPVAIKEKKKELKISKYLNNKENLPGNHVLIISPQKAFFFLAKIHLCLKNPHQL